MDERDYKAMNAELKNQTAVEWLFNNLYNKDTINDCTLRAFKQALKMEKQQIIDAHGNKKKNSNTTGNYEYTYTGEMYFNDNYY
jgi:hypothetical protein